MKRSLVAAAATVAITGTMLLGGVAGADPNLNISADDAPVTPGATLDQGQNVVFQVSDCMSDGGQAGYLGMFLGFEGDPATGAPSQHVEAPAQPDGSFYWDSGPIADEPVDRPVYIRWYCAESPASSWDDAAMLYRAPLMTMTVRAGAQAQGAQAQRSSNVVTLSAATSRSAAPAKAAPRRTASAKAGPRSKASAKPPTQSTAATTPTPTLVVTSDPDALPDTDRIGIVGPRAATLKRVVDTRDWFEKLFNPRMSANRRYVRSAYATLTGRIPSAQAMQPYVDRLDAGDLRVRVVEDIALSVRPDAHAWNTLPLYRLLG